VLPVGHLVVPPRQLLARRHTSVLPPIPSTPIHVQWLLLLLLLHVLLCLAVS
jgi:hypothetical protein